MTKAEMQDYIKNIISADVKNGFEIFACLKKDGNYNLKRLRATNDLINNAERKVFTALEHTFLPDDVEYDTSDNIADNKKSLYEVQQDEDYHPFDFLQGYQEIEERFTDADRKTLSGFFFRVNLNEGYFWIYQHVYSVSRIDRSKHVFAIFVKDTYEEVEGDILQIDTRADLIVIGNSIITSKVDLLQRSFAFESYIRAGAQKTIGIIEELDIVQGLEKFFALESKQKLTNAKKLLKARNSSVLTMDRKTLLYRLKAHSRYSAMFVFEDDHVVINSQKDAAAFIKMLNDDIVRSELTGQEYDSSSKLALEPQ